MKLITIVLAGLILLKLVFADDIYEYKDAQGTMVFTNKPVRNAKKVNLPPISVYASPMSQKDYLAKKYTEPQPVNNDDGIKKIYTKGAALDLGTNESGRRQILAEELTHEKQGLQDAKDALATAKQTQLPSEKNNPGQYQARIQALQDAITEHEKNIDILSKQLGY